MIGTNPSRCELVQQARRLRARVPRQPFEFRVTGSEGNQSNRSLTVIHPGAEDQLPVVSDEIVDDKLLNALTSGHIVIDIVQC